MKNNVLIECQNIELYFEKDKKHSLKVLDRINFTLHENEIVTILGKSGAGKSSFLRIAAGLLHPSYGSVLYKDKPVTKPLDNMSMVFQNFALLPWLNVVDNILFGSDALGVSRKISEPKAHELIQKISLQGFEKAYVNELSGGMKQRVGFARALMVEPEILFLDEPFSSLDITTANTLRSDILNLWLNKQIPTKSMVLVTHSVEEAVMMADRVIIFDNHPGKIAYEHTLNIPRLRDKRSPEVLKHIDLLEQKLHSVNLGKKEDKVLTIQP
ncbi:ABC transporter ATP-binding protein [Cysteiniphilum litorale]|uniref:ABC transporter ATP-binding protein n=1 Tax=Cysteiniphilum litorale TaxID=2056700 RepID=UPI003F880558